MFWGASFSLVNLGAHSVHEVPRTDSAVVSIEFTVFPKRAKCRRVGTMMAVLVGLGADLDAGTATAMDTGTTEGGGVRVCA